MIRKLLSLVLVFTMICCCFAFAEEPVEHGDLVILYTNDVHCGIEDGIGYAGVAAYKKAYADKGYEVELVDCGDAMQGGAVGTISKGEYILQIMNEIGYDVATIGNHEFDYGLDRFYEIKGEANYDYVCCNFVDLEGNPLMDPYVIRELAGWKIAFVGIATPETFTKSTPTFFQDEEGNYIYDFCNGNNGQELYAAVQTAVDSARAEGADIVIALSHLGIAYISEDKPWLSSDVITNTTGIDVVLDGHSHSVLTGEKVLNKEGKEVLLTSTGTKLESVGALTITAGQDGPVFSSKLHTESLFQDPDATAYINTVKSEYSELLNKVVAHTDVDLVIYDPVAVTEEGKPIRIVRRQETNLGDLCADGYRILGNADIGVVNGGGVRADIPAGDITYNQILAVHPFGNKLTVVEATGQQILDLLEMSVSKLPGENGGFQHVSGLTYEVNVSIPTPVVLDENSNFVEVVGDRRVQNVLIAGEPIDPEKTYTVSSHNYMLKEGGDGLNMFKGDTVLLDEILLDNQVLMNYIIDYLGGVVGEEYADPYGQGRVTFIE